MFRAISVLTVLAFLVFASTARAQASFDCAKAQSASENAICADQDLQWSDGQLARLYKMALGQTSATERAALIESQRSFLARREACPQT